MTMARASSLRAVSLGVDLKAPLSLVEPEEP
jgi:hypothetical protein